jgi:hypothetical protein
MPSVFILDFCSQMTSEKVDFTNKKNPHFIENEMRIFFDTIKVMRYFQSQF